MDEAWLKELNKRNFLLHGENSSKCTFATITVSSSVLAKLSQEEKAKSQINEFKRATNKLSVGQG